MVDRIHPVQASGMQVLQKIKDSRVSLAIEYRSLNTVGNFFSGLRLERAALRCLQDPPAEQGVERRQEGQLHQARVARVQHPQEPSAPSDRPAL